MDEMPIATRIVSKQDGGQKLQIKIFAPIESTDGEDWSCDVSLVLDDGTLLDQKVCWGVDAVQALQASFAFVRSKLADDYVWLGETAKLGFPKSLPNTFGIDLYSTAEKLTSELETDFVKSHRRPRST